jgi:hypothetical protein
VNLYFVIDTKNLYFVIDTKNLYFVVDTRNLYFVVDTRNLYFVVDTRNLYFVVDTRNLYFVIDTNSPRDASLVSTLAGFSCPSGTTVRVLECMKTLSRGCQSITSARLRQSQYGGR